MRDYAKEFESRVNWIRQTADGAGAKGVIFGNSGGKDSALVGILCKAACESTLGVIMPCQSKSNYGTDKTHAELLAKKFNIETLVVDLTSVKEEAAKATGVKNPDALANINPRLRMLTLYAMGQERGFLVAGTGNLSEITMGYFTKYGDGGCDFNPIADLTATEVREFLAHLNAPKEIIGKPASAGLWDGQTDEAEMGISYAELDAYILTGKATAQIKEKVEKAKAKTEHKRKMPAVYK